MVCKHCGYDNPQGAKFCRKCGTPMPQGKAKPQKKNTGLILGIIIAAVIVILAIVAIIIWLSKRPDSHPEVVVKETGHATETQAQAPEDTEAPMETELAEPESYETIAAPQEAETEAPVAVPADLEWLDIEHGISTCIEAFEADLVYGDTVYVDSLSQNELNRWLMNYCRADYGDKRMTGISSSQSSSQMVVPVDQAQRVMQSLSGHSDYQPSSMDRMNVSGSDIYFDIAFGAPIYISRLYKQEQQGNQWILGIELCEAANIYTTVNGVYEVVLEQNNQSMFGASIRSINLIDTYVAAASATGSSKLVDDGRTTKYQSNNVLDHDMTTAWVEGVAGNGINEWIQLNLSGEQTVHGLRIANGYFKSEKTYKENAYPSTIMVEFSDGSYETIDLINGDLETFRTSDTAISLGTNEIYGMMGNTASSWDYSQDLMTAVSFGREVKTSYVKIYIVDAVSGSIYQDNCISEIELY